MSESAMLTLLSLAAASAAGGFGAFVAVRVELTKVGERSVAALLSANKAHERIDSILAKGHA